MFTFNLFSFLFQVKVVMNWLILGPLFTAAVSIQHNITFGFHKLPAHKPCRSRCQSSESTEFLCRHLWIYPTCILPVGFFFQETILFFRWIDFCEGSVGQDENTGSVEKHSYHTRPLVSICVFQFLFAFNKVEIHA
jgi:hypothetical protein